MKKFLQSLGGFLVGNLIYATIIGLFAYRAFAEPPDPRVVKLSLPVLAFWAFFFSLMALCSMAVISRKKLIDQAKADPNNITPEQQDEIVSRAERPDRTFLTTLRYGYFVLLFIVSLALIAMCGYTKTTIWLGLCELVLLAMEGATAAATREAKEIRAKQLGDALASLQAQDRESEARTLHPITLTVQARRVVS